MSNKTSRRNFLKTGVTAGVASMVAPYIIPSHVLGKPGQQAGANDTIVLGAIGTGSRFGGTSPGVGGVGGGFARMDGVVFAAVADVQMSRANQAASNLGDNIEAFQDYRYVLDRQDIDAVIICSPDHWHAQHSIHAALAGKDVYCEKALTLTIEEGRAMVNAIRQQRRVLQTGSQQRSQDSFYRAIMLIRNGYIGDLQRVVGVNYAGPWENALPGQPVPDGIDWDSWMGPVHPHPYNQNIITSRSNPGWLSIRDFCGGEICGWGAHGLDQIQWGIGADDTGPTEVWVEGSPYEPWVADANSSYGRFFGAKDPVIHYRYANGVEVELSMDSDPNGGARFIGTDGEIFVDRGNLDVPDPEMLEIPYEDMEVQLQRSTSHNQDFLNSIRNRTNPICDVEIGHRSATMCHLGNIARWVSQKTQSTDFVLNWDPVTERFTNNEWANYYISRPRRKGYELPVAAWS